MTQKEAMERSKRKRIRQPPAVPFLWEERPGIPKRDWKPGVRPSSTVLTPPVKLTASVPFNWEEKPGTPLPSHSQPPLESGQPTTPQELAPFLSPSVCYQGNDDVDSGKNEYSNNSQDEDKGFFELDLEAFDFETDDSFSSAPSLLANCLVPSVAVSSAVPVQESSSSDDKSPELEIPSTPASETDSSTSSYATGFSSLVGASFLECLFPLLPPHSSFLEKAERSEMGNVTQPETKSKDFDHQSNSSVVIRRPTTLGELIMMSRRRSYQRKAAQIRKQNLSMEFAKKGSGCCIFGSTIKMIEGLQRKKHQAPANILKLLLK